MIRNRSLSLLLALLLFTACGDEEPYGGEVLRSDKQRVAAPVVAGADLTAQVQGDTAFGVDFFQQLRSKKGNLFISPHSISTALAMLHAGARGNTEKQMAQALHYVLPQSKLHAVFNKLDLDLQSRGKNSKAADGKAFRLNIVNATWGQQGYHFLPSYLDTLAINYGAGLRLLDFITQPELSRQIINKWVLYKTEDRIKDLLPQGIIKSSTRLVLTNAIYFNAAWAKPFKPENTLAGTFTLKDSAKVSVPMMKGTMDGAYTKGQGFQAAALPYDGNELSMIVLLPDAGTFDTFEKSLTGPSLETMVKQMNNSSLILEMPKFQFEAEVDCKAPLKALGMTDAFSSAADLSGIDGSNTLFVQAVLHKAFVKVNEAGTEAAAATAVVVGKTSAPPVTVTLKVDRPFIFLIRDHATGAILFLGRVLNPA